MANKHDYLQAYKDVFNVLVQSHDSENRLKGIDERTKAMAIKYLKIAAEKGDQEAIDIIEAIPNIKIRNVE